MKVSARNVLKGTLKKLIDGAVNSEVIVELPGGQEISSIITKQSAHNLQLAEGQTVYAIIKASEVIVGVD
jgi:molybdopterin-binding protein